MSLALDTLMVGGATFLVGSVLMEISVKDESGEPVGWWPYVGTFVAGALGFYLLAATNVVKVKNAESSRCVSLRCNDKATGDDGLCDSCYEYMNELTGHPKDAEMELCPNYKSGDGPCWDCEVCTRNGMTSEKLQQLRDSGLFEDDEDKDGWALNPLTGEPPKGYYSHHFLKFPTTHEGAKNPAWVMGRPTYGKGNQPTYFRDLGSEESFSAEGPTDDELETWSERQEDGSMKVTIDEDGESHTELTYKDGDLTDLKRFMAEVFEADRKARRRTTLTWTRGIEPSFYDKDKNWVKTPRPYDVPGYYNDAYYEQNKAYHISGLPDGYHIHLWKPLSRRSSWTVLMKSPLDEKWGRSSAANKSQLMHRVLEWYNEDIAVPIEKALTPVEQLMISQGMISGDLKIQRVVPVPGQVQYFFEGGPQKYSPTKFVTSNAGALEFEMGLLPSELLNFSRGLIYLRGNAGDVRSVNRYNKDRKQWVKSQPAWFQNMCREGIKKVYFGKIWNDTWTILDKEFLRFYGTNALQEQKTVKDSHGNTHPRFQVHIPNESGEYVWTDVRPTTQKKMYDKAYKGKELEMYSIVNQCVEKYQPQKWDAIKTAMQNGRIIENPNGWGVLELAPAGQIMCRRFKKN